MKFPSSCCGCCSLQTGTIIIGCLDIISGTISLISLILMSVSNIGLDIVQNSIQNDPSSNYPAGYTPPDIDGYPDYADKYKDYQNVMLIILAVGNALSSAMIAFNIIMLILIILLIAGAAKKNPSHLFPYLCMGFANLVISLVIIIAFLTFLFRQPYNSLGFSSTFLVIIAFTYFILWYRWQIVYNFYRQLLAEKFLNSPNDKI